MPKAKTTETNKLKLNVEANQLNWNVDELVSQNQKGAVDFSVPVQRGYVWDNRRSSLLIHSVLLGIPISEFYFNRIDRGKYEGLEGKQRNKALCDYVNGLYKLHANTPSVLLDDETEFSVARLTFDKLPEELQNRIRRFPLRIFWFDNASIEEKVLIFTRINSGKPVTNADIARIRVLSRDEFVKLAEHQAITTIVRLKSKLKLVDEDIVEDIWILANVENPSLMNRDRAKILESTEATEKQLEEMSNAFDYMLAFYKAAENDKKLFQKLRAKTHITSLGYMGVLAVRNGMSEEEFIEKATTFFNPDGTKTTSSDAYNDASISGSSKPEQVKIRVDEIQKIMG